MQYHFYFHDAAIPLHDKPGEAIPETVRDLIIRVILIPPKMLQLVLAGSPITQRLFTRNRNGIVLPLSAINSKRLV